MIKIETIIKTIIETTKENLPHIIKAFPLALLIALVLAFIGNSSILNNNIFMGFNIDKISAWLVIGFFIFVWAGLHRHTLSKKLLLGAYAVAFLVWVYLGYEIFYVFDKSTEIVVFKAIFLTLGFILAYTYVPFLKNRDKNLTLLIHIHHLQYAFLGSLRFISLFGLALLTINITLNFLFNLRMNTLLELLVFNGIFGIFLYIFFTTLMVNPNEHKIDVNNYTQKQNKYITWLLYGFTAIIFTALNIFVLKIIITQELPKGQISWLVMGFSFFAFMTYLSLVPYKAKIKKYNTLLWGTLLLQSLVLLGSIGVRVYEYGVTEKRYLLVAYGLWLFGISIYFLIKNSKAKIFWLFASLSVVVFLSQISPINGYLVSKYSQQQRFVSLIEAYKKEPRGTLKNELVDVFRYLKNIHGITSLSELYPNAGINEETNSLKALLGDLKIELKVDNKPIRERKEYLSIAHYQQDGTFYQPNIYEIDGYNYFISNIRKYNIQLLSIKKGLTLQIESIDSNLKVKLLDEVVVFDLTEFLNNLKVTNNQNMVSKEEMTLLKENENWRVKLIFTSLDVDYASHSLSDFMLDVYVGRKESK